MGAALKQTQSTWRKGFREGWAPDTLSDSVREVNYAGYGVSSKEGFYHEMLADPPAVGIWDDLPFYPRELAVREILDELERTYFG